jgi:hypothetical protein
VACVPARLLQRLAIPTSKRGRGSITVSDMPDVYRGAVVSVRSGPFSRLR